MGDQESTPAAADPLTTLAIVEVLGEYARSCLRGQPDAELAARYADTSLAGQFAAIAANPKIAKVYA